MIVKHQLLAHKDIKIYQDTEIFNFSLDSVLLGNFVTINKDVNNIIDLGTGNAPIPLIMSLRTRAKIIGIEIQKNVFDLAKMTIKENGKEDQIEILNEDIKELKKIFKVNSFDIVVSNPPYFEINNETLMNVNESKKIARHEILVNIEQIVSTASFLLKNGGNFAIVHRPERLIEIITLFKKHGIEPKKIQLVFPSEEKDSNMFLLEGTKQGKKGLKIIKSIITHKKNGEYTEQVKLFFGGNYDSK